MQNSEDCGQIKDFLDLLADVAGENGWRFHLWFHLLMIGCNFNHKICFSGGPWSILSPSLSPGIMNAGNYETSLGIASKTWRYLSQRGVSNFRNLVEEMGIIVNPRQLVLHKRAKNMIMFWKYQMRNDLAKIFTPDPLFISVRFSYPPRPWRTLAFYFFK